MKTVVDSLWTAKQRQGHSLHEISYRACFKPQLPHYFITRYSKPGDWVYDPFSGRGTTGLEAALLGRNMMANDVNPLSQILLAPRLNPPTLDEITTRMASIPMEKHVCDIDLSMFFHHDTLNEILSLKHYLLNKEKDHIDDWLAMVATNRLTGHSPGFFSVYTLPPNQATNPKSQQKINEKRGQKPPYRDVKALILKKSKQLLRDKPPPPVETMFLCRDARYTTEISDNIIALTVTSPPFLDIVQYDKDNWLRCWFNGMDARQIGKNIASFKKLADWQAMMTGVFKELYRITKPGGHVAFEVGEVKNGKVNLEQAVIEAAKPFFTIKTLYINQQKFTKTANIWGVKNNQSGTNSNRIVLMQKS